MNWQNLKERFPKVHDDLRELFKNDLKDEGRVLINCYIEKKGLKSGFSFIPQLNKIESEL